MDRVLIAYRYSASFRIAYDEEDQRWSTPHRREPTRSLLYDDIAEPLLRPFRYVKLCVPS